MGKSNPSRRLEKWEDLLGLGGEKERNAWRPFCFLSQDGFWGNAGDVVFV